MERYIHNITDSDDKDTMESKHDHNSALMNNTQLHIIQTLRFQNGQKQEWPKELQDLCREFEDVLVEELDSRQMITCPPMHYRFYTLDSVQ